MAQRTVILREPVYALSVKSANELQLKLSGPQGPAGASGGGGASITVSTTPPVSPTLGAQWYDPEDRIMAVWDGSVWVGTEFLPITVGPDPDPEIPALAYTYLGEPYTYLGEYFTAPTLGPAPALAFLSPGGEPYLSPTGEYYLAPA